MKTPKSEKLPPKKRAFWEIFLCSAPTDQRVSLGVFSAESAGAAEDEAKKHHRHLLANLGTNSWHYESEPARKYPLSEL
jgi:hypothetical protein